MTKPTSRYNDKQVIRKEIYNYIHKRTYLCRHILIILNFLKGHTSYYNGVDVLLLDWPSREDAYYPYFFFNSPLATVLNKRALSCGTLKNFEFAENFWRQGLNFLSFYWSKYFLDVHCTLFENRQATTCWLLKKVQCKSRKLSTNRNEWIKNWTRKVS